MRSIILDLTSALRFFARRRAATSVIVLTMAFAIAANTAVFSVLKSFLFSSLAVPESDRVMFVWTVRQIEGRGGVNFFDAFVNVQQLRANNRFAESMGATLGVDFNWQRDDGSTQRLQGTVAQADFFKVMRVQPVIGRLFTAEEEGPSPARVALISTLLWRTEFNGSLDVLGRTLRLNGATHTIIGVMPDGFALPMGTNVWLPFDMPTPMWTAIVGGRQVANYARLAAGVTESMARDELRAFAPLAIEANPDNKNWTWTVQPVREAILNGADRTILLVQVGAAVLLLLAISNLASLLMAWAAERQQETALRLALGASSWRLVRQFLVQSVLLVAIGGALGIGIARFSLPLLEHLNPSPALARFLTGINLDTGTLAFATALMLATGLVAGLLPALHARKTCHADALRAESRGTSLSREGLRWQKAMIVVQGAVSVLILVGAGLAALGFSQLNDIRLGFESRDRVVFQIQFPEPAYATHEQRVQFIRALEANFALEPAIGEFGFSTTIPVGDIQRGGGFTPQRANGEWDADSSVFQFRRVSPGYIPMMGTPLIEGRLLNERDVSNTPHVAVISQAAARKYWPGESAIGRKLRRSGAKDAPLVEVVGIVGDVRDSGTSSPVGETIYMPWEQVSFRSGWVLLKGNNTSELFAAGRRALGATAPDVASFNAAMLDDLVWQAAALPRLQIVLLGVFAAIAISITALGSYGVMSQLVSNRQREMAIRAALGATRGEVLRLVLRQNAKLAAAGALIGIVAAWVAARSAQSALTAFPADTFWPYATVVAFVLLLTQIASYIPARRAAALDVPKTLAGG
jgi:putative ABC transport system permease protein